MTLVINNALMPLLRNGYVDGKESKELFEYVYDIQGELAEELRKLGLELVIREDIMIAHARRMSEETLEALTEKQNASRPVRSIARMDTFDYHQSVVIMYFRLALERENIQGGEPIWISYEEVFENITDLLPKNIENDESRIQSKVDSILTRLEERKLIERTTTREGIAYRGTRLLLVAFNANDYLQLQRKLLGVAEDEEIEIPNIDEPSSVIADLFAEGDV